MLPPANRLRKEKEIKRALASKKSIKSGLLMCKTALNGLSVSRFCFVVSKKISNKAAVRNKLKRRLRAAAASFLPRIKPGYDCVFLAFPGLESGKYEDIKLAVGKILASLGVLNK